MSNMKGMFEKLRYFAMDPDLPFQQSRCGTQQRIAAEFIDTIRTGIKYSFPRGNHSMTKIDRIFYPSEDLESLDLSLFSSFPGEQRHTRSSATKMRLLRRYNPFSLRLPDSLQSAEQFFISEKIDHCTSRLGAGPSFMNQKIARAQFLDFLREYNLLYVDVLEAINGSKDAIVRIKSKLTTDEMYQKAGIDTKDVRQMKNWIDLTSQEFRQSLLAYLVIDVLRSPRPELGTAARVHALGLLRVFGSEAIASSFLNPMYFAGFGLPLPSVPLERQEYVHDLIPAAFVRESELSAVEPHNDNFLNNDKVKGLFKITSMLTIDFKAGYKALLRNHPAETVQVLLSLMRRSGLGSEVPKLAFHVLMSLTRLKRPQREVVFGPLASYRNTRDSYRGGSHETDDQEIGVKGSTTDEAGSSVKPEEGDSKGSAEDNVARVWYFARADDVFSGNLR